MWKLIPEARGCISEWAISDFHWGDSWWVTTDEERRASTARGLKRDKAVEIGVTFHNKSLITNLLLCYMCSQNCMYLHVLNFDTWNLLWHQCHFCYIFFCIYGCFLLKEMFSKKYDSTLNTKHWTVNKQLSCRRQTTRCFVSLNVSLSHSKWHPWVGHV